MSKIILAQILMLCLATVACGEDSESTVPAEPCDVVYSITCGEHMMGAYARCYGDKTGYALTDGTKFECTIGDHDGCLEAGKAARAYCYELSQ